MKVPYSMDDNEQDLYGSLGGHSNDDWDTQTQWEGNSYGAGRDYELDLAVQAFRKDNFCYTQEDITKVIQHNLKTVNDYRNEIEELLGLLSYIYNHSESLPQGVSQQIREQITMERIWEKMNETNSCKC